MISESTSDWSDRFKACTARFEIRVVRYRPNSFMPRHAHDDDGISLVLGGEVVEEAVHRSTHATAGWVVVKPRSTCHETRFGAQGATLLAIRPLGRVDCLATRWRWDNGAAAARAGMRLARRFRSSSLDDAALDDEIVEYAALLAPGASSNAPPRWLRRVREALESSETVSVHALAGDADVHPVYLARAFRRAFGVSLREYRQLVQARRAADLVATTEMPLSRIALDCGFVDQSHMCRTFRSVLGLSPTFLRA